MDDISTLINKSKASKQASQASGDVTGATKSAQAAFSQKMEQLEIEQKERMVAVQAKMLGLPHIQ